MSIFPKLQLAAAIKKHFQYALGLFICAFLLHCEVKSPVGNEKGAPFSGSIRVNDGVSVFPLKGAVVVINNRTTKTDSNGTFGYEKIRKGTYQLTISHASIIAIDTTITISKATHVDFVFRMFDFEGTVYRLLLPHEQVLNPYVPEFLRERAVIAASITLDGKYTRQAASNPGSCNENFDFGLVRMGTHRLQIAAPKTHLIDTVFVINHKSGCFLDTDAYHFTLPTIAPPQREFVFPLSPRSSWRYRYDYSQSSPVFHSQYTVTGQHIWTIKEVSDNGTTLTAFMQAIRTNKISQSGIGLDTTYTKIDTVQFTISKLADKIVANWPRNLIPSRFGTIPRFHFYGSDTLEMRTNITDTPVGGRITYISGIGMESCSASQSSNSFTTESYRLLEYKKE